MRELCAEDRDVRAGSIAVMMGKIGDGMEEAISDDLCAV